MIIRFRLGGKSTTVKYIVRYRDGLNPFLADGRIELDNNSVESSIIEQSRFGHPLPWNDRSLV